MSAPNVQVYVPSLKWHLSMSQVQHSIQRGLFLLAGCVLLLGSTGCRLEMYDQQKLEPYEPSPFFADSQGIRPYIPGTVPRSTAWEVNMKKYGDSTAAMQTLLDSTEADGMRDLSGRGETGANPFAMSKPFLLRGKERYSIYCSPCHGSLGDGNGMIVQRGMPRPPTFHSDRLRQIEDYHFYDVITNGFGIMYSYASRVPPADRWAITAYVRALQLSQNATGASVPESTISARNQNTSKTTGQ